MTCPICKNKKLKTHMLIRDTSMFSKNGHVLLLRCNKCAFVFNPYAFELAGEDFKTYYQGTRDYDFYKYSVLTGLGSYVKIADNYVRFIESHLGTQKLSNCNALDIGGGAGEFCFLMKSRGYNWDLFDYSRHRTKIARGIFNINNVYNREDEISMRYDIITLWQVIEHVLSPVEYLKNMVERVGKKECHIFLATPNVQSLGARLYKKAWQQYVGHHISLFSHKSIEYLFRNANIELKAYDNRRMYGCTYKHTIISLLLNIINMRRNKKHFLSTDGLCAYGFFEKA